MDGAATADELFDENGRLRPELAQPRSRREGEKRIGKGRRTPMAACAVARSPAAGLEGTALDVLQMAR